MRNLTLLVLASSATLFTACVDTDAVGPAPTAEHVLAEFERPTGDGLARYVFRFVEDDGAIATLIGTPRGYPAPVDDPCALDTFLKVAPDDAVVPSELRRACGDVGDLTARRVADLRTPGLTFAVAEPGATAITAPFCADADYDARFDKLLAAAKVQATKVDFDAVCVSLAERNPLYGTCKMSNPSTGEDLGTCDYEEVGQTCGTALSCCLEAHLDPREVPNPACAHAVTSWSSPQRWLDWEGDTDYGASKFQAEVSACDASSTTVIFWMKKNSLDEAWGPVHQTVLAGSFWWVLKLDSGTTNGNYRGARYLVHANGNGVRPAYAAAMMEGTSRTACPIPFPL